MDISNVGLVNGVISFDVTIIPGLELAEALDNYDLSWQSGGGGGGWYGQMGVYFYDNDAAESGDISDNQSNYLETTVQGPVNLAFYWKVSSEEDYDYLTFYVDDTQIYQISGEVDWEQKIYSVDGGSHSIKWEYKKDEFVSDGFDRGWVDKVEYTSYTKTLTLSSGTGGTTDPAPGTYTYDTGTEVSITATPDTNYRFSGWTGDVPSGHENDNPVTITMDADKTITATFSSTQTGGNGNGGGEKKGCFIATAAYGSPLHPHLDVLRDFRDSFLMPSRFGRKLVELYYRYSPGIAGFIAEHKLLKASVRVNLLPMIAFSSLMVHFGPSATAIVLVFILVFSILFIRFYPGRARVL